MLTLNIGTRRSPNYREAMHETIKGCLKDNHKPSDVIWAVDAEGFTVVKSRVVRGDGEDTVVLEVMDDRMDGTARQRLYRVAEVLQQDCVAFTTRLADAFVGALVGPYAHLWGSFDQTKFVPWQGSLQAGEGVLCRAA